MNLNIDTDLLNELIEAGTRSGRPDETHLILEDDGWRVRTLTYPPDSGLVAMDAESVLQYLDGEDLDEDTAQALVTPDASVAATFEITRSTGGTAAPGADWQVVTAVVDDNDETVRDWTQAWAFNIDDATEVVTERRGRDDGVQESLWLAEDRYLLRRYSIRIGQPDSEWIEISPERAAELAYDADEDQVPEPDALPLLLAATRLTAQLAAQFQAPEIGSDLDPDVRSGYARKVLPAAVEQVKAAKVVSDLIRSKLLSSIRAERVDSARLVVLACHGDRGDAAKQLNMAYSTLSNLIKDV
jgi:hypothetical protein